VVIALPDDWRTEGDWLGRYGRHWACCCAICSPDDYTWGAGQEPPDYFARIGPHHAADDTLRYWVHWLYTDNRKTLEMPPIYYHSRIVEGLTNGKSPRRQAEWDDHAEAYPMSHEGPDIYCTLRIPSGLYFLSLYDMNKDGHEGSNRWRDYRVSIRRHTPHVSLREIDGFEQEPELARARIHDFWGGVWKRFLVRGPTELTIRVGRNWSFNTLLAGVMLDPIDERPPPYFGDCPNFCLSKNGTVPLGATGGPAIEAIRAGLTQFEGELKEHPAQWAIQSRRRAVYLLRAANSESHAAPDLAASCAYYCNLFTDWEREQIAGGLTPARKIEKSLRFDGVRLMDGHGHEAVTGAVAARNGKGP
jgi:hypothetical protein